MISGDGSTEDGDVDDQSGLRVDWEKGMSGKVQVQARYDGCLFHCDSIKVDEAKERAQFAKQVADRAREQFEVEIEAADLESDLLEIIDEMADAENDPEPPAAVDYLVVEHESDPDRNGIYRVESKGPIQLCNAIIYIDRDITVKDGPESRRRFEGRGILHGKVSDFRIDAEDFGNGNRLAAAIFEAAGAKVQILCKYESLSRAISAISEPTYKTVTTDFGWSESGDAYLSPSVRVDADGIHPTGADDLVRVDLSDEQCARHLDLALPAAGELDELKKHVVDDLLKLHDRQVTFTLLAAAALGVLFRFVLGTNRPAIWLVGLTGGGKSFAAKLFQNFFGSFPIELGSSVGSWSSTSNFLQRQGYFFKDTTYLVDDYKPEVTRHGDVLKLLQNYADGSARGRLNSDATSNVSREIRGILICTGESIPEQSPSAMARTVIVDVGSREKDVERGARCLARRERYPALMAGFIEHVIAEGRGAAFAERVRELQQVFYRPIAGAQNDLRIAANHALLAASFEEFARYLGEVGAEWTEQARLYVDEDLPAMRDRMVAAVKEQQPSEILLATLRALITNGRVRIHGWTSPLANTGSSHPPTIGKAIGCIEGRPFSIDLNMTLALEAVQECLRRQAKPPLATTPKALLDQLAEDGKLLDHEGRPLGPGAQANKTRDVSIAGSTRKAFRVSRETLFGRDATPRSVPMSPPERPDDD
jgi:hypothetical protein